MGDQLVQASLINCALPLPGPPGLQVLDGLSMVLRAFKLMGQRLNLIKR